MIYLDHNATTPIDHRVLEAMMPYLTTVFGNPSSTTHAFGWDAVKAVQTSREALAKCMGSTEADSIIFTAGATEANNLAILGAIDVAEKPHLITQKTEHDSVLRTFAHLASRGCLVTYLDVDETGWLAPERLRSAMTDKTRLVSIMFANNEVGTVQEIRTLAGIAHEWPHVLFHTDAAQAMGKVPIDVVTDDIDLMSFTAHKCYGPKGVGGLYVSSHCRSLLKPIQFGGGQEHGLRPGTLNVAGIVGLAKAMVLGCEEQQCERQRLTQMRDHFIRDMMHRLDGVTLNGHPTKRLFGNVNLSFAGVDAGKLTLSLKNVACSAGS
ncbi:MAG TPA: cysteine desulfurase family protein, partial [bacterium]|nr:cysteine desulfurase family protein [bacterium]